MPLHKPAPMPRPILKKPRAPPPPPAPATSDDQPASPSPSSGSSSFDDDGLTTLSEDIRLLIELLTQKLGQNSSIYDHDASKAGIMHHQIRKVMRRVREHPVFPDIENDIPGANFYIAWGILEAESLRWSQGPGLRQDRGKVAREQRAIRRALREMGVEVSEIDGAVEAVKGKEGAKIKKIREKKKVNEEGKMTKSGEKKRVTEEVKITESGEKEGDRKVAKGGMVGLKRVLNQLKLKTFELIEFSPSFRQLRNLGVIERLHSYNAELEMPEKALSHTPSKCKHSELHLISPAYRSIVKSQKLDHRPKSRSADSELAATFPDPLVLPDDELAEDPDYPEQSFQDWVDESDRNIVTAERKVIYVAIPPPAAASLHLPHSPSLEASQTPIGEPDIQDIVEYISAFYHGIQVKLLPPEALEFTAWDSRRRKGSRNAKEGSALPSFVGLKTSTECVRIRNRQSPDGVFQCQLNLGDILETVISMVPDDAYALVMLTRYDLYEEEADEFQCGRAYGGSRVAVVSLARYNANLDAGHNVEREHAWPASHCAEYVRSRMQEPEEVSHPRKKAKKNVSSSSSKTPGYPKPPGVSPMQEAVEAYTRIAPLDQELSQSQLCGMWLARICRTMTHELGHCFGIDHCIYYACSMQGTASIAEDVRQPPYLCPVDLDKMLQSTGESLEGRYERIAIFLERYDDNLIFAAYAAWIRARLNDLGKNR